MTGSTLRIVTRESPLALWQAEFVRAALQGLHPGLSAEIHGVKTVPDRFLQRTLADMGGKGMFVKELEQALLNGEADLAVHSMKDVTVDIPPGLSIPVIMQREDPRDVLISERYARLAELPAGAKVGTSSLRRQCQLNAKYPGLDLLDIRGNVGSRLQKLDNKEYDALILAAAGVKRLGMENRIKEYIDVEDILPAVGQGALGIEIREGDRRVSELVRPLNHEETNLCVTAERALSRKLYGGCHLPIAAYAEISKGILSMTALAGHLDGSRIEKNGIAGAVALSEELGRELGERLLKQGADEILAGIMGDADN